MYEIYLLDNIRTPIKAIKKGNQEINVGSVLLMSELEYLRFYYTSRLTIQFVGKGELDYQSWDGKNLPR